MENRKLRGLLFFLAWFVCGGLAAANTVPWLLLYTIGGVSTPPAIWSLCLFLGVIVLPILLPLGGVPAAIRIARGRPWEKVALLAFAVCATAWLLLAGTVFWGPSVFGWTW